MAIMKEVAKEAGVSVATVSAVINSNSKINVSDNLRFKVKKAVEKLNYHPNGIARALSNNKTSFLAYVIPSISNDFFLGLLIILKRLLSIMDIPYI